MKENNNPGNFILSLLGKENSSVNPIEEKTDERQKEAEVAIEDLRNKYSAKIREQFESSAQKLRKERDDALRENWILQQQAEAALPEQMAAAGINGGISETTLSNLRAKYQGSRNEIQNGYMDDIGDLAEKKLENQSEAEKSYNEKWLEYLLSLAQMEEKYKYEGILK